MRSPRRSRPATDADDAARAVGTPSSPSRRRRTGSTPDELADAQTSRPRWISAASSLRVGRRIACSRRCRTEREMDDDPEAAVTGAAHADAAARLVELVASSATGVIDPVLARRRRAAAARGRRPGSRRPGAPLVAGDALLALGRTGDRAGARARDRGRPVRGVRANAARLRERVARRPAARERRTLVGPCRRSASKVVHRRPVRRPAARPGRRAGARLRGQARSGDHRAGAGRRAA